MSYVNDGRSRAENDDDDDDWMYEEESGSSMTLRIILFASGSFVLAAMFYLFVFYLPNVFIPEARELKGFALLSDLNTDFEVLKPLEVIKLPSLKISEQGLDFESDDESDDGDEVIESNSFAEDIEAPFSKRSRRLIMIGDVHGNLKELKRLLKKVKYNGDKDTVLLLGDMVSKGPNSLEVLDYAIDEGFECILGNHEYYVMQYYATFHHIPQPFFDCDHCVGRADPGPAADPKDPEFKLATRLQPRHVEFINSCSAIKKLGKVPLHKKSNNGNHKYAPGVAVHAGIMWNAALEEQEPIEDFEMRSLIGPYYNVSTDDPKEKGAVSWSKIYNKKLKAGESLENAVVYYGHDARRDLNFKKYTKGIDTGCIRGRHLTGVVLWREWGVDKNGNKVVLHKEEVVQVRC